MSNDITASPPCRAHPLRYAKEESKTEAKKFMLAGQIAVIMSAIFGLVAPILNKGKNKIAAIVSLFAGASPYLSILAFEGKIQFPDSVDFLWWVFLIASGPAFILCAILYSKLKSKKARNAAFIGAVIGTGTSIYMWTCLAGFGV